MNIFFTASLRGKETHYEYYQQIYALLAREHTVFAEHVFDLETTNIKNWSADHHFNYYKNILEKIKTTDLVVAEVSFNSINIGYEISLALEQRKCVIAVYTGEEEPLIFKQIDTEAIGDHLYIINYTALDLQSQLQDALAFVKKNLSQRFTLLLPYTLINYLEHISKQKHISKSLFIRKLIEHSMDDFN